MMLRRISLILICGLALLCVGRGPVRADDTALIDPSTTIVTVDGVPLSAGLILVPAGKDLEKWWAGEGHDSETQERVRKELDTHSEAAVDTELLRAMFSSARKVAGDADDKTIRPILERFLPSLMFELRQENKVNDWSKKSPSAEPHISAWLTSSAEVKFMTMSLIQNWLETPDQTANVRAHWAAHRDDYLVLKSARWRQITVLKGQVKDVERLLLSQVDFEEFDKVAKAKSLDRYRQEGGLVESEAPHLFVEDYILVALKRAKPGKGFRVNHEKQVIFVMPETLDWVPAEFQEVTKQVRLDLARLRSSELAKRIAVKRRAKSRIEWQVPIRI